MVTDSLQRQGLQLKVLADETADDDVERFQNYGHTSVPPAGSEAIVLGIGGARAGLVAIAVKTSQCAPKTWRPVTTACTIWKVTASSCAKTGSLELEAKTVIINASEKLTMISPDTEIPRPAACHRPDLL